MCSHPYRKVLFGLIAVGFWAAGASAGSVLLGNSGWRAVWDPTLDPYVDIHVDSVEPDAVYIQKTADFVQPPGPGGFPGIPILFQQVAWPAVTRIVIDDEIIFNHTGFDWPDFHWDLLNGPDAWFHDGPGYFFYTHPLNNQHFSPDLQHFWVDGFGLGPGGSDAVVANGTAWFPGNGALNGQLVIDVVPQPNLPYTVFTLKETPTPEPAAALLLLAGLGLIRRR